MPSALVDSTQTFKFQLATLVRQLEIEEAYQTLKVIEEAVRQYLPVGEFWHQTPTAEYKCRMEILGEKVTLTLLKGSSEGGRERATLKGIVLGEEEIPETCLTIPLQLQT